MAEALLLRYRIGHGRNNRDVQVHNELFGMSIELISMVGYQIHDKRLLGVQWEVSSLKSRAPEDSEPFKLGRRTLEYLEICIVDIDCGVGT